MDGKTLDVTNEKIEQLKSLFPEIFTEGKVDFKRLRHILGDAVSTGPEHYELTWAGKSESRKDVQKQSTAALLPDRESSINFDNSDHVFIEGENLEVLKVLQKSYFGKIKIIYIDPPYNTGNDSFVYPDDYSESQMEYNRRAGITDDAGFLTKQELWRKHTKEGGQFHSIWLSMMYPRLYLARNLLREDGIILISIDDNEVHNLRMVMNEIFGEENFIEQLAWKNKYGAGAMSRGFANVHEYILCYSKAQVRNIEAPLTEKQIKSYKLKDEKFHIRGPYVTQPLATTSKDDRANLVYPIPYKGMEIWPEKQWVWEEERTKKALANNEIVFNEEDGEVSVRMKQYLRDENGKIRNGKPVSMYEGPFNQEGNKDIKRVFGKKGYFSFPKPVDLIKQLLSLIINADESNDFIVLDFFGGSATTAQAVMELNEKDGGNRKFIVVQFPEPSDEDSLAFKDGYMNIAQVARARIQRVIQNLAEKRASLLELEGRRQTLGFRAYKLAESNFKQWRGDIEGKETILQQLEMFTSNTALTASVDGMFNELLLKAGAPLTTKIETIDAEEGNFYFLTEYNICMCLQVFDQSIRNKILDLEPTEAIVLDALFESDELLSNTKLEFKEAGIKLTVI